MMRLGIEPFLNAQYRLAIIPAQAGIQFQYVVRSTQNLFFVVCFVRHVSLDSGLRRNDDTKLLREVEK